MNGKTSEMDMLHGPLSGKLLLFTLPIALSSMVQQLFNAADTAVVGDHAPVTKDRYDAGGKYDFSHKFHKTGSQWLPLLAHGL